MFQQLKLTIDPENTFFVSDLHHNHNPDWPEPIWKQRGFGSKEECDEALIAQWNAKCNAESVVINMGDPVFGDPDASKFYNLMRRLNFKTHYLVIGNHVSGHLLAYKNALRAAFPQCFVEDRMVSEVYPLYHPVDSDPTKVICFLPQYAEFYFKAPNRSYSAVVSHYNINGWNGMAKGTWLCHGHEHGNVSESHPNETNCGKRMDFSVENLLEINHFPMRFSDVERYMARKQKVKVGHH